MLLQRLVTAALLALVLLPSLFFGTPLLWAGLTLLFLLAAAWEWARLIQAPRWLTGILAGFGLGALSAWAMGWSFPAIHGFLYGVAALFWLCAALPLLMRGQVQRVPFWLVACLLASAWLAVVQARIQGVTYLLSVVFLVIAADSFAYFVGRKCGRHKLAPQISPGKTIEGALGGLAGVLIIATVFICWVPHPNFFSQTWQALGFAALPLWMILTAVSILGDLFESGLKRAAGVKDSSQLLPGHGGVLDRVDALLPVLPLTALISTALTGSWL